mgnify:CR=1 FL=1
MFKYALQRLLYMVFVLLIITAMCFTLIRLLPVAALPPGDPHSAVIEARRAAAGYNEPIPVQFFLFLIFIALFGGKLKNLLPKKAKK